MKLKSFIPTSVIIFALPILSLATEAKPGSNLKPWSFGDIMRNHRFHLILATMLLSTFALSNRIEAVETSVRLSKPIKTGKERLGKKASDEQRLNNCKVPIEKRGSKPRPFVCPKRKPER